MSGGLEAPAGQAAQRRSGVEAPSRMSYSRSIATCASSSVRNWWAQVERHHNLGFCSRFLFSFFASEPLCNRLRACQRQSEPAAELRKGLVGQI